MDLLGRCIPFREKKIAFQKSVLLPLASGLCFLIHPTSLPATVLSSSAFFPLPPSLFRILSSLSLWPPFISLSLYLPAMYYLPLPIP
jgi:hypothetical protein